MSSTLAQEKQLRQPHTPQRRHFQRPTRRRRRGRTLIPQPSLRRPCRLQRAHLSQPRRSDPRRRLRTPDCVRPIRQSPRRRPYRSEGDAPTPVFLHQRPKQRKACYELVAEAETDDTVKDLSAAVGGSNGEMLRCMRRSHTRSIGAAHRAREELSHSKKALA